MNIQVKNLIKSYKQKHVLNIDSMDFKQGSIYAIAGPNGAGKTTLLRLMAGIEKPSGGQIVGDVSQQNLSFMTQKPYLFDKTVLENVALAIGERADCGKAAMEALKQVGMDSFANARARSLSGGEQQRVALARTLAQEKPIVLLDEPTAAIDISAVKLVEDYICRVRSKNNSTIIFTTHNPSQALRIADELVFMSNGTVLEKGPPSKIVNSPEKQETREFLQNWRI